MNHKSYYHENFSIYTLYQEKNVDVQKKLYMTSWRNFWRHFRFFKFWFENHVINGFNFANFEKIIISNYKLTPYTANQQKKKFKRYLNILFNIFLENRENTVKKYKWWRHQKLSRDILNFFEFFESFYGAKYVWKVSSLYHFSIEKKVGGVILLPHNHTADSNTIVTIGLKKFKSSDQKFGACHLSYPQIDKSIGHFEIKNLKLLVSLKLLQTFIYR